MQNEDVRNLVGEIVGTFIMVFIGVGAVASATLWGNLTGPFQVGMCWGLAVAVAIYMTRNLSDAHFNTAVSFAMLVTGNMSGKKFIIYTIGQFIGAIVAGLLLYFLFAPAVAEAAKCGMGAAAQSIWSEVYPNASLNAAAGKTAYTLSPFVAACAEGIGIGLLVIVIMGVTDAKNEGKPGQALFPLFIGIMLAIIICVIGPLTDAGLNPARDFGPRIAALIVGMPAVTGTPAVMPMDVVVYIVGPLVGGAVGGWIYKGWIGKAHAAATAVNAKIEEAK